MEVYNARHRIEAIEHDISTVLGDSRSNSGVEERFDFLDDLGGFRVIGIRALRLCDGIGEVERLSSR